MQTIRVWTSVGMRIGLALGLLASTLLLSQNCSSPRSTSQPLVTPGGTKPPGSGGQSYDGKPYVEYGNCADSTLVKSRLLLWSATSATLVREDCVNITPRNLGPGEFTFDPQNTKQILIGSKTLVEEISPFQPLTKAYFQWNPQDPPAPRFRTFSQPIVYILDPSDYTPAELATQTAAGHTVVCLDTAGTTSDTDPDRNQYTASDVGNKIPGTNEYWLDTRSANVRRVMILKLERLRNYGCRGMIWDQTDGYVNNNGFNPPLDKASAIDFLKFLAFASHDRKMFAVLSNTPDLSKDVVSVYDMQYSQNCHQSGTCDSYKVFNDFKKPVLLSEDGAFNINYCNQDTARGFTLWFTSPTQDASRYEPCP